MLKLIYAKENLKEPLEQTMNLREALAYARDNYHAMIYSDLCILGVVYAPTLMSADFHIMEVAIDKDLRIDGFIK